MRMSDTNQDLAAALSKAQAAMRGAAKDSTYPHFKSKYADLASVRDACFPALTAHGLSVVQGVGTLEGKVRITTMLLHESGQWVADDLLLTPQQDTPQAVGSAITYGRRYGLAAIAGVAPEDDDAEAAQGRGPAPAAKPTALPVPIGFPEWWDNMTAASDEGLDALQAAWKQSSPEMRAYVDATRRAAWDSLKARAKAAVHA